MQQFHTSVGHILDIWFGGPRRALIAGFLDMFLPALMVANIDAEITRFVIGVISLTQLIYMSEVGILMIKCEIPLRFHHLFIIFVLRTLIGLPIVFAFAHWVVY